MKKLLKQYGFNSDMQYFEMIAESFLNGQISQAIEQFKAMPKINRVQLLKSVTIGNWQTSMSKNNIETLFYNL